MGTTADADQQCEAIARCLDHAVSKKGNVIVPSITGRVYLHSTRMKENQSSNLRGVISGGLDQVRVPSLRPIVAERIPIMISEPIATTTGQINGNSSSTPTTTARTRRVLFICAKRQPATPIGHLRLAPSSGGLTLEREASPIVANSRVP